MTEYSKEETGTTLYNQISILGKLYNDYRDSEEWKEFFFINNLGLPLAWLHHLGMCLPSEVGLSKISQSFANLLSSLEVEDTGFTDFWDLMGLEEDEEENENWWL